MGGLEIRFLGPQFLLERGDAHFGVSQFVTGRGSKGDPMHARLQGYRRAVGKAGPTLVWAGDMEEQPRPELIAQALRELVVERQADAILASNDIWAAAFLKGLKVMGRSVPGEVAVVGFDNLSWSAWLDPALTTIDQQHREFATAAVGLMARLLSGKAVAARERTVVVTPRLVERETS